MSPTNNQLPFEALKECSQSARTYATLQCPAVCVEVAIKPYYQQPKPYRKYIIKGVTDAKDSVGYGPFKKYMLIFEWSGVLMEPVLLACLPTDALPRRFSMEMSIN